MRTFKKSLMFVLTGAAPLLFANGAFAADAALANAGPMVQQTTPEPVPPGPTASTDGANIIQAEKTHRAEVNSLERQIEIQTLATKLEEQKVAQDAAREKAFSHPAGPNGSSAGLGFPYAAPAMPAAPIESAEAKKEAAPSMPELTGNIGQEAYFRVDGNLTAAGVGGKVGSFRVVKIEGRRVTINSKSSGTVTLISPN